MISITDSYINNIPWKLATSCAFGYDVDEYEAAFKSVIEKIPATISMINFEDSIWDFRPYYKNINTYSYVMRFQENMDITVYLKFYVIYSISRRTKISTCHVKIYDFYYIITNVYEFTNHKSFNIITTEDIINTIESNDAGNTRKHHLFSSAYLIYDFILKNFKLNLPINVKELKNKASYYSNKRKRNIKTQNIPEEYYDIILKKLIHLLDDKTADYKSRMTAGLLIICTQTGLRRQDLVGIQINDLKEKYLPKINVKCHFLHYQTRKPSKPHNDMLEFDIFASPLCAETFSKMLELRKQCPHSDQPYLYVINRSKKSGKLFPVQDKCFVYEMKILFSKHLRDEASKDWDGIEKVLIPKLYSNSKKIKKEYLSIPKLSQYRVHLATALYNKGVSLVYIQKYLGHLSEFMLGYYVRPKDNAPEDAKYAETIVKKIAEENMTPLGSMGNELKERLISFIEKGKYNVKTDTEQILKDLGDKLVIREKGGGLCCIKASIIPCKHDARTNETLCAYGLCPNIFHFYDIIDVSYMQFHSLQETYQFNLDRGMKKAAQKELNKLKDFIKRRLKPEFIELKKVVKQDGLEHFSHKHPNLKHIAENIGNIEKEIDLWEKC